MQIVAAVVIDAFLSVVDAIRVTPAKQARQLCRQHSGALRRQVEHFVIIHSILVGFLMLMAFANFTTTDRMADRAMFVISCFGSSFFFSFSQFDFTFDEISRFELSNRATRLFAHSTELLFIHRFCLLLSSFSFFFISLRKHKTYLCAIDSPAL